MIVKRVPPGFWFVERVEVLTQRGDDALVLVGILAEDVLDDDDRFLYDIVDLRLDEVKQGAHTTLRCGLHLLPQQNNVFNTADCSRLLLNVQ